MSDYEKGLEKNRERNKKFFDEFESWLQRKNLGVKTIRKHLSNIDLYVNDYLNYYEVTKMEEGLFETFGFLNGWFIRKCLWASKTSIKDMAASIRKFYKCMCELGYVNREDYNILSDELSNNMDEFLESLDEFDNFDLEDY